MKDKQREDRIIWLQHINKYIKPGKIVEFGCGSGFVLESLSKDFPDSFIVGIDKDKKRLQEVLSKNLKNVIVVNADITQNIFPNAEFDTALIVAVLHEVSSYLGHDKVLDTLRIAHNILKDAGVLIIQDFLKPMPKPVELIFKNEQTKNRFFRFAKEFKPRKVEFKEIKNGVRLDIADAIEFISKLRSQDEEDWREEMEETHLCFTENDFHSLAKQTGFVVKELIKLPKGENWQTETIQDFGLDFLPEYQWVQCVLTKK